MIQISDVKFINTELLTAALTHKSFANEQSDESLKKSHNEKLEFLGDAVLDLVLGEALYLEFSIYNEGQLSKMRAHLVNEGVLAEIGKSVGLTEKMKLGKSELLSQGAEKPRLLASCFEAIVGALFVDQGYEAAKKFTLNCFAEKLLQMKSEPDFDKDYKSQLQEMVQAEKKPAPTYEILGTEGPAHEMLFKIQVRIANEIIAIGQGKSKKIAEQAAAELAIKTIVQRKSV